MRTILTLAAVAALVTGLRAAPHSHVGPHKGPVAEWGEEQFHLEVVADAKAGTVTVYVYGDHDELHKGVPRSVDATPLILTLKGEKPITIKLEPTRQKLDPEGKASVFAGKHEVFTKGGKLEGTLRGYPLSRLDTSCLALTS